MPFGRGQFGHDEVKDRHPPTRTFGMNEKGGMGSHMGQAAMEMPYAMSIPSLLRSGCRRNHRHRRHLEDKDEPNCNVQLAGRVLVLRKIIFFGFDKQLSLRTHDM